MTDTVAKAQAAFVEDWTSAEEHEDHDTALLALANVRVQLNDLIAAYRTPSLGFEFELESAERYLLERAC